MKRNQRSMETLGPTQSNSDIKGLAEMTHRARNHSKSLEKLTACRCPNSCPYYGDPKQAERDFAKLNMIKDLLTKW